MFALCAIIHDSCHGTLNTFSSLNSRYSHEIRIQKMIDDNMEKKPDAKKPKADAGKKTEHAKADTGKEKTSHKK